MAVVVPNTLLLKVKVVKGVVVQVHGVQLSLHPVVIQIRTGFRMLKPRQVQMLIGINVVLMGVNTRAVVQAVDHIITVTVVKVVRVWLL